MATIEAVASGVGKTESTAKTKNIINAKASGEGVNTQARQQKAEFRRKVREMFNRKR